jgi:hypothetical protein
LVRARIIYEVRPDVLPEMMRKAVAAGLTDALLYWQDEFRPLHFMNIARSRYGYQPRSGDDEPPRLEVQRQRKDGSIYTRTVSNPHYSWRKRREQRHNLPLVWSGASARASKQVRIDTGPGATAKLAFTGLPKYFFQYLKAGTYYFREGSFRTSFTLKHDQPKKFEELVIVIPEEKEAMAKVADQGIDKYLAANRAPATVSV